MKSALCASFGRSKALTITYSDEKAMEEKDSPDDDMNLGKILIAIIVAVGFEGANPNTLNSAAR